MQRFAALGFVLVSLTCFTGCPSLVRLTNNGPNPVIITGNPSAVDPDFPLEIAVGDTVTIDWASSPVTINAVDKVNPGNSDTLENVDLLQGGTFVGSDTFIDIEWTGTDLINHGSPD